MSLSDMRPRSFSCQAGLEEMLPSSLPICVLLFAQCLCACSATHMFSVSPDICHSMVVCAIDVCNVVCVRVRESACVTVHGLSSVTLRVHAACLHRHRATGV